MPATPKWRVLLSEGTVVSLLVAIGMNTGQEVECALNPDEARELGDILKHAGAMAAERQSHIRRLADLPLGLVIGQRG